MYNRDEFEPYFGNSVTVVKADDWIIFFNYTCLNIEPVIFIRIYVFALYNTCMNQDYTCVATHC